MQTKQNADDATHDNATVDDVNFPDMSELSVTIVGPGAVFKGDIHSERGISIFGKVVGNVNCQDGLVHVGDTGVVTGDIEGYNVEVDGLVEGDVLARHTLKINGKIRGEMSYMVALHVAPDLDIDGHIRKVRPENPASFVPPPPQQPVSFAGPSIMPTVKSASAVQQTDQSLGYAAYAHVTQTATAQRDVSTPKAA
jgi:cytoskeletal protein CcmA (bactofilin family)